MSLDKFAGLMRERVANDWDVVIGITGEEGAGKTTLAIMLSMLLDPAFDLIKNVAYLPTYDEVEAKFRALKGQQVFLIDEAIKVLYKLRWADKLQISISEMYATERWQNKITIMCMPRFSDFSERFRNHRIKIWIHVITRGVAVVMIKDDINIYTTDPWYMGENSKTLLKATKMKKVVNYSIEEKLNIFSKSRNFLSFFKYDALAPETELRYKEIRASSRKLAPERDTRSHEILRVRNKAIFWLYEHVYVKENEEYRRVQVSELGEIFNIQQSRVSQILAAEKEAAALST
jgi:hypothetical protein